MRFICYHKVDDKMESGAPVDPRIITEMTGFMGELFQSGVAVDGAGLHRSATRVRLTFDKGARTVTKGPFRGSNELLAGFVQVKAKSMDEAVEWASRIGATVGDGEIEIGPVVEPWDLGLFPKPSEDLPGRYLILLKGNAATERGERELPRLKGLLDEMDKKGVLLGAQELAPSATGKRYRTIGGKKQWTDGPYAESKELIAGFCILELSSREELIQLTEKYAEILGEAEVDVREVA